MLMVDKCVDHSTRPAISPLSGPADLNWAGLAMGVVQVKRFKQLDPRAALSPMTMRISQDPK